MQLFAFAPFLLSALIRLVQPHDAAPPGGIRLLDGYSHEAMMGLDTVVGRITRDGGPDIDYDIGRSAGHLAGSVETPRWTRRQFHNGTTLTLAMSSGGDLYASYDQGPANFIARRLKSDADLAEVLLMILTYRPIDHFR